MNRRDATLVLLALAALPPAVGALQPGRGYRIGILSHTWPRERLEYVLKPLGEVGDVEGRNTIFDIRYAQGRDDLLDGLAAGLVENKPDLVVAIGNPETLAAKRATSTIPTIMFVSLAPQEAGLIASLAHPGGNVTGTTIQAPEIPGKFLELLKDTVPNLKRVTILWEPDFPGIELYRVEAERAAQALGIRLTLLPVRTLADLGSALVRMASDRPDALFVATTGAIYTHMAQVIEFAMGQRLPAIYGSTVAVLEGGLMSYIAEIVLLCRRAAAIIDRILKGAKPGEIPVEQPSRFELLINLKTAKALGITVPQSVLLRADEVIQ